ncbi:MAG: hypothetical protein OEU25_15895, partial [Rhodospirillales bacterium]|nr:hypothetical protein [Rhodospirillales bacterium]
QFWVVGGEHTGTKSGQALGRRERWIGPFGDYELAREEWQRRSSNGAKARSAARYRIEHIDPDSPPPCTD